jgi:hypothetical protein
MTRTTLSRVRTELLALMLDLDYPLTVNELRHYLPIMADIDTIQRALRELVAEGRVLEADGEYVRVL